MDGLATPPRRAGMSRPGRAFDSAARAALQRSKLVHSAVKSPAGQFSIQTTRGCRQVQSPFRFAAAQLLSRRPGVHRLKDSGLLIEIRHGTPDVHILNEIYRERLYDPPAEAASVIAGLGHAPKALDLGGNIGLFGTWFFGRFPDGELTTLEPDPSNAALIRRTIERNRLGDRWTFIEACASNADGSVEFLAGDFYNSRIPTAGEAGTITVPARDVFALAADADLVKIDIEGGEWAILTDARFGQIRAPVIAMEWHTMGAPGGPNSARDEALSALTRAGYRVRELAQPEPHSGTLWAWR